MQKYAKYFLWVITLLLPFTSIRSEETKKPTICLNMIVKNESAVILRCLESVLPIIDHWIIVDTGSTDGTQDIIRDFLYEIPGELYERPWVNFGHNRDEALQLAKPTADYVLFMDADDALLIPEDFVMPELTADSYLTSSFTNGDTTEYHFTRMVKSSLNWHWKGVIHEYVCAEDAVTQEVLTGISYAYLSGGARSKDPETFYRDIKLIKQALLEDPTDSRYVFYLAQSYMCVGELENAMEAYKLRVDFEGWEEEVFWSKLQIGRIQDQLAMDREIVIASLYDAYFYRPFRIEPLYYIAAKGRWDGEHQIAYEAAKLGIDTPYPHGEHLFIEKWIYDYGLLFEYSIAAFWVEKYQESLDAMDKLLTIKNLPDEYRKTTVNNRHFVMQKIKMINFLDKLKDK